MIQKMIMAILEERRTRFVKEKHADKIGEEAELRGKIGECPDLSQSLKKDEEEHQLKCSPEPEIAVRPTETLIGSRKETWALFWWEPRTTKQGQKIFQGRKKPESLTQKDAQGDNA